MACNVVREASLDFLSFGCYHIQFTHVLIFFNNSLLFAVAISVGQKRLET